MPHFTMHILNAFLLSVLLIPLMSGAASRAELLDLPEGRKMHEQAVPPIGGLAMFFAFLLPAIDLELRFGAHWGLLAGISVLVGVGVVDDMLDLDPWTKLAAQVSAALLMTVPEPFLTTLPELWGGAFDGSDLAALAFSVLMIVGMINAFNMMDGLDGLAGGLSAIALLGMANVAGMAGRVGTMLIMLILLFAVLGFLLFNMRHRWRQRAAVFMGDAGSMMLGGTIAYFIVKLAAGGPDTAAAPLPVVLWFVAIPAFDTLILIARRLARGCNPLVGDRRHLHHFLLRAGLTPQGATAVLIASSTVLGCLALMGLELGVTPHVMLLALAIPFALHFYVVTFGWRHVREWLSHPVDAPERHRALEDSAA